MGLIKTTSGAAALVAGLVIITAWMFAARDKNYGDSYRRCHGCIQFIHEQIKDYPTVLEETEHPSTNYDSFKAKTWLRVFRDPYSILISFACILCVAWLLTGFIGLTSNNSSGYRLVFMCINIVYHAFRSKFHNIRYYLWHTR
jgi:hypothetical protein